MIDIKNDEPITPEPSTAMDAEARAEDLASALKAAKQRIKSLERERNRLALLIKIEQPLRGDEFRGMHDD